MGISRPILLVDDDNVDAAMAQRALQDLGISDPFVHVITQ
jgi:CheY-like chemotaxis protein